MRPSKEFEDRIAWISGAASGIGRSTARLLAQSGAHLALIDIHAEGVESLAAELRAAGAQARAWQADLRDASVVEQTVNAVVSAFGGLHLAVNNAGISGTRVPLVDQPLADWHRVIDVNLNSVFYAMKYQIPHLLQDPNGSAIVDSVNAPANFENGQRHTIDFTRDAVGEMVVSIDGAELIRVRDVGLRDAFTRALFINKGGDYRIQTVAIYGTP